MHAVPTRAFVSSLALAWLLAQGASRAAPPAPGPAPSLAPRPAQPSVAEPRSSAYDREVQRLRSRFLEEAGRSGSPAAIVPLLSLPGLWDWVDDRAALIDFAKDAARPRPTVLPTVQAQAKAILRSLLLRKGDRSGAAALNRELGYLQTFAILGPFDNEGRRGHAAVYPPEQEERAATAEQTYEGRHARLPLHLRTVPPESLARDGSLHLESWMSPDTQGTAYAVCYVKSQQAQRVAVRVSGSGALKAWVNRGPTVVESEAYHPRTFEQAVGSAQLVPGWNRILIKLSAVDRPWTLAVRLTGLDGSPLPGPPLVTSATPPSPDWPIPKAAPAGGPAPASLERALRERLARVPLRDAATRAQAMVDLGTYLHYLQPGDVEKHEDETLLSEAMALRPSRRTALLLASASSDHNQKRQALEQGAALPLPAGTATAHTAGRPAASPGSDPEAIEAQAQLLFEQGRIYEEGQRQLPAEAAFRQALSLVPTLYGATLSLAQLQAARGLLGLAEQLVQAELASHRSLRLLRAQAELLERGSHYEEAAAAYQRILNESPDDSEALRMLLSRARAKGDVEEALSLLARLGQAQPELLMPVRERVEILEGAGRIEPALAEVNAAMPQLLGDPDWHERRGRLLSRLGRADLALPAYRRSLELKPQNPTLRKYMVFLDPQARSGEDLARAFRVDVQSVLARPRPPAQKGDAARVLLDQQVTRVHENGLSEVYAQRLIEILDERGASEYDEHDIRFTPDTQSVEVKAAKVYKTSGEVQEAAAQDESNVSEPWYGLYYDVHAQSIRFSGLRVGDVVYVEYILADVGRRNLLSDYFGDVHFFQEEIPRIDSRYTLVLPEALLARKPLYFNPLRTDGIVIARSDRSAGADHIIEFRAENVPRLDPEPGMPGFAEVAPYVHVSTYKTWEDVAIWYQGLVAEQLQPSPEISRAAREAVAKIPPSDERARIAAIYNFVVRKTRYVGLEFGIHGYKPYKVAQIYQRKFGDCKDKASLLKVMLKEVGIDSTLVLARTRRGGSIAPEPASLSVFDHAIVYIPKFDLYLDGTAEFSGSIELPTQDQDIMVLVVSDPRPPWNGKGHLARTPVLPAPHSTVARRIDVKLAPDGSAQVHDDLKISGQPAERWREHYQSVGEQRERYEKAWNEAYPGSKAVRVEFPGLSNLEQPVMARGDFEIPAWGRRQGSSGQDKGDLVLRPLGRDADLLRNYARLSQRRHDLILGFPWVNQEQVTLTLPASLHVRRLPEARHIRSAFGQFEMIATQSGNTVVVKALLRIDRHRVQKDEYAEFRRFCTEVDSAVTQELVVGHGSASPAAGSQGGAP